MASLRATVEKVRAEKAAVEEQLTEVHHCRRRPHCCHHCRRHHSFHHRLYWIYSHAYDGQVQGLLAREQEVHRGLQEVGCHCHCLTVQDDDPLQVVGREREEWAGEREASAHLIQVGRCHCIRQGMVTGTWT